MKQLFVLISGVLLALPALAQTSAPECAEARDPVRCEARQAALATCAEKHGADKRACLDARMPPLDCSKAADPQRCEAIERAKEICKGKNGKELKSCLKAENPKKSVKGKKTRKGKTAVKKKKAVKHHAKASPQH
ncbi:MAG: hypothetical protein Q7S85_02150 [Rugosibacter sp.]|nr:hypothetical protein [Rugosibacter sp.]